jgi:glucose-1-phosphate thymidylyltransferase
MKGIVLAGGTGSRLWPLTKTTSKQLLPIYDKPLIYFPLSTLMLAGISKILIITTPQDQQSFINLLGDGSQWGIELNYEIQQNPGGLAQGLLIGEDFLAGDSCAFILGDNIFYGQGLGRMLQQYKNISGATIFSYKVKDPERYGVVEIDQAGSVVGIEEKPEFPRSNLAVTGLYFYDGDAPALARSLKPSARGEIEITDLNKCYLEKGLLNLVNLPSGTAWFDTGTFSSLHDASSYIRIIQERQGLQIADLDQISKIMFLNEER